MSIYECSITNPKKQLEFYKDLSEQLQRENQQLRIQVSAREEVANKLQSTLEEIREYIKELKPHWVGNDMVSEIIDDLLQIIDKGVK